MISEALVLLFVVSCALTEPVSQPLYSNQYVSGQTIPTIQFKPQAPGYLQQAQSQYQQQPSGRALFEARGGGGGGGGEGLQQYSSGKVGQPIQQVLLATNINGQKASQQSGPVYLQQYHAGPQQQQAAPAQTLPPQYQYSAQRKPAPQTVSRPVILQQAQPQPQPQQYLREQPAQIKYVPRPVQYRQQQQQQEEEKEQDDYDPNPTYQFGFDVKDDLYTNYQNRKEQREGNKITGSYSVVDSDGFVRTVTYTADPKEGFKAQVSRQPTDIVVKIPKPDPQFQRPQQQYIQAQQKPQRQSAPSANQQGDNIIYQYE